MNYNYSDKSLRRLRVLKGSNYSFETQLQLSICEPKLFN